MPLAVQVFWEQTVFIFLTIQTGLPLVQDMLSNNKRISVLYTTGCVESNKLVIRWDENEMKGDNTVPSPTRPPSQPRVESLVPLLLINISPAVQYYTKLPCFPLSFTARKVFSYILNVKWSVHCSIIVFLSLRCVSSLFGVDIWFL